MQELIAKLDEVSTNNGINMVNFVVNRKLDLKNIINVLSDTEEDKIKAQQLLEILE